MSAVKAVPGHFQKAGSSALYVATASLTDEGLLLIQCADTATVLAEVARPDYRFGTVLPGLPVEVQLRSGGIFRPDDASWRWPQQTAASGMAAALESNRLSILAAVLLSPLLLWWIIVDLMPMLASASVLLVPDHIKQKMGEETFYTLQKTALQPTQLPATQQATVNYHWQMALQKLPLQQKNYQLYMYQSEFFGANAFALPNGTVVITDELVNLLQHNPDAIVAVLLHEIGHVEGQHSVRLVAQSLGATLVIGILFGNPDGVADLLLGSGSVLLQNAFSRDMEREADQFALKQLKTLGKSPTAFADAMSALLSSKETSPESEPALLKYLSTHPATRERTEQARQHQ